MEYINGLNVSIQIISIFYSSAETRTETYNYVHPLELKLLIVSFKEETS